MAVRVSRPPFIFFAVFRNTAELLLSSVIEMQVFLVTLVRKFDISPADHHPQIRRVKSGLLIPMVLGEEHKGTQLPLKITLVRSP